MNCSYLDSSSAIACKACEPEHSLAAAAPPPLCCYTDATRLPLHNQRESKLTSVSTMLFSCNSDGLIAEQLDRAVNQ